MLSCLQLIDWRQKDAHACFFNKCLLLIILASNVGKIALSFFADDVATGGARNFKVMKSFSQQAGIQGGLGAAFPSHATFPHYAIPQGLPYHIYGYPSLPPSLPIRAHIWSESGPRETWKSWGVWGYHMHDMCIVTCHLGQWWMGTRLLACMHLLLSLTYILSPHTPIK
jgi:hypothetical protein